ncbi:MAG: hypothetical protein US42_C0008G0016 [Candidatus Magasanikbacteria bacterium GW2011_GWC2_37_14]|uniref:Uncharacterized protein n=1 Tax=Candidatus Magasanikbacteria bacterium GW2011_GWC2_37_14 TaxID=1619046 RepID=A0A0G0GMX1_9BACT|nr:MAG: hypothetical protein US42_C0008G0016 [Candidatus Magasanikbacteria bacterium GW2011_GWC2_37_14]
MGVLSLFGSSADEAEIHTGGTRAVPRNGVAILRGPMVSWYDAAFAPCPPVPEPLGL